jgi:phage tail-like protein
MPVREDQIYVPPAAFSFRVDIDGAGNDTSFQEVSGLKVEFESEDVAEGGQNAYTHKLPTRTKYANLMLKRGVVAPTSPFGRWVAEAMARGPMRRGYSKTIVVKLLNEKQQPLLAWKVFGAYPLRWELAALNAMGNEVLTETIELSYQFFRPQDC